MTDTKESESDALRRIAKKCIRMEAERDALADVLRELIEINKRDETCDPDVRATETWRKEVYKNTEELLSKLEAGEVKDDA